jgi:hypothetical protein
MASSLDILASIDELRSTFGPRGLERIEDMLRIKAGVLEAAPEPFQEVHNLHIPRLQARPWHDVTSFAWHSRVRELIFEVKSELGKLRAIGARASYAVEGSSASQSAVTWPATPEHWVVMQLYRHGAWHEANTALCPSARRLVEQTPYSPGEGFISILAPEGRIQMHSSGCNAVLTCHAPLVTPAECYLQVALETRAWRDGIVVVFDDSFLHRAWNNSSEERIVLLWEIWHPDLTALEIAALEILYPSIMKFHD